jgi:hypothetical protein
MKVTASPGLFVYIATGDDWRIVVEMGRFEIQPQVGAWEYSSGINLDNLAALIVFAKAHATAHGIDWSGN